MDLRIDRSQARMDWAPSKLVIVPRDGADFKEIGHPTTLIVNQQESHIMRVEVNSEDRI